MKLTPIDFNKRKRDPRYTIDYGFSPLPDTLRQWYRDISIADMSVYHTILYHTRKFKRKKRAITQTQFCNETGLSAPQVSRSVRRLESLGLILIKRSHRQISIYEINTITRPAPENSFDINSDI